MTMTFWDHKTDQDFWINSVDIFKFNQFTTAPYLSLIQFLTAAISAFSLFITYNRQQCPSSKNFAFNPWLKGLKSEEVLHTWLRVVNWVPEQQQIPNRPKAMHYTSLPMKKIPLWKMDTMFSGLVPGPRSIIQLVCIVWREHRGLAKMLTKLHNMCWRQHTMKCLVWKCTFFSMADISFALWITSDLQFPRWRP